MLFARIYRKISFREGVVHYIQDSRAHFFILPHQLESPGKFCVQRRERERERETYPLLSWNRKVHILSGESDILRLSSTSTCHHHSTHGMRTGVLHSFYCMLLIISPLLHILLTRFVWRLIYRYKERQQKCNLSSCC